MNFKEWFVNKINEYSLNHIEKYEYETLMQYVKFKHCDYCNLPLYPFLTGEEKKQFFNYEKDLGDHYNVFNSAEERKQKLFLCDSCLSLICPRCFDSGQCVNLTLSSCKICENPITTHIPHLNRKKGSIWCPGKDTKHAICKDCRINAPTCKCGAICFCSVDCGSLSLKCTFCKKSLCQDCDKYYIGGLFVCAECDK